MIETRRCHWATVLPRYYLSHWQSVHGPGVHPKLEWHHDYGKISLKNSDTKTWTVRNDNINHMCTEVQLLATSENNSLSWISVSLVSSAKISLYYSIVFSFVLVKEIEIFRVRQDGHFPDKQILRLSIRLHNGTQHFTLWERNGHIKQFAVVMGDPNVVY